MGITRKSQNCEIDICSGLNSTHRILKKILHLLKYIIQFFSIDKNETIWRKNNVHSIIKHIGGSFAEENNPLIKILDYKAYISANITQFTDDLASHAKWATVT